MAHTDTYRHPGGRKVKAIMLFRTKSKRIPLDHAHQRVYFLGRGRKCDLYSADPTVSALHARVEWNGTSWVISDADSKNGVYINDIRLSGQHPLQYGDRICTGRVIWVALGDGGVPLIAETYTQFLRQALKLYGSIRRTAAAIKRGRSTIWRFGLGEKNAGRDG